MASRSDTKTRILDAAEKLFAARKAEQDYLVTVHQITNSLIPTDDSEENA